MLFESLFQPMLSAEIFSMKTKMIIRIIKFIFSWGFQNDMVIDLDRLLIYDLREIGIV